MNSIERECRMAIYRAAANWFNPWPVAILWAAMWCRLERGEAA